MTLEILSVFLASLGLCGLLVLTKRFHGRISMDMPESGVQKFHQQPTPRIGGVAIMLAIFGVLLWDHNEATLTSTDWLLLSSIPAFVVGVAEDLTKKVGVTARLLATMLSGLLFTQFTGYSLNSVGIIAVDDLLAYSWVAVPFTAFAMAGLANAYNIVDGFNGLSSGLAIIALLALAAIAHFVGDQELFAVSLLIIFSVAGFLVFNFPFGKIFLGDGGAYAIGFLVAAIAIILPARNPDVSPWASLVACSYPIIETLYSIYRRRRDKLNPGHPDSAHLHSTIRKVWVEKHHNLARPILKNAFTSIYCWILAVPAAGIATFLYDKTLILFVSFAGLYGLYVVIYRRLLASVASE